MSQSDQKNQDTGHSSSLNDGEEAPLSVQVLPRRASAKAASDAIRKSYKEEKIPESSGRSMKLSSKSPGKSSAKSVKYSDMKMVQKLKLKQCVVKLHRLETDPKFKKVLTVKYGKDMWKRIADHTLCLNVGFSTAPKHIKLPSGYRVMTTKTVQSTVASGNFNTVSASQNVHSTKGNRTVQIVMVTPKPGAQIVNPGRPVAKKTLVNKDVCKRLMQKMVAKDVREAFTGQFAYRCELCNIACASVRNMVNHKRLAHKNQNYLCYSCGLGFETSSGLHQHDCHLPKPIPIESLKTAGTTHSSRSVIAVFPNKSQLLISEKNLTSSESAVRNTAAKAVSSEKKTSGSGTSSNIGAPSTKSAQYILAEPGGKHTCLDRVVFDSSVIISEHGVQAGTSTTSRPMNFVCETCLDAYPSSEALDGHSCSATLPPPVPAAVSESVSLEVEQLARFYSSVVFQEF